MTKLVRSRLLTLVAAILAASFVWAAPARFAVGLKDAAGKSYEALIFANDEKLTVVGPDEAYGACSEGDRMVSGMWQVTLRKHGSKSATPQKNLLLFHDTNRGEFNLNRHMVFALPGRPSILVVEQYSDSNGHEARLFAISGGKLRSLSSTYYRPNAPLRLHGVAPLKYRSAGYDNSVGLWTITDWKFDPAKWRFSATRKRQLRYDDPKLTELAR
ncbi:MAG: hypothetical protein ACM3VW_00615 [Bacteroidota bacterium]